MKVLLMLTVLLATSIAFACPENKCANNADLIGYIVSNSHTANGVDEDLVITELASRAELTNVQLNAVLLIFKKSHTANGLDEDRAILNIIDTPHMTLNQAEVLKVLIQETHTANDIDEDQILEELLKYDISKSLIPVLTSIIRSAHTANGVVEDAVLLKLIRSCPRL